MFPLSNSKCKTSIDGQWLLARSRVKFNVPNLTTNDVLCSCPESTTKDVQVVIKAANRASRTRQHQTGRQRVRILRLQADLVTVNARNLNRIITAQDDKPKSTRE